MTISIYRTPTSYYYAVETGQPTDPICVGEGDTAAEAVEALSPTALQSVGRDTRERDLAALTSSSSEIEILDVDDLHYCCDWADDAEV